MNTEREKIENLRDGEGYTVPESDYGKAEIWFKSGTYFLFSIPFGGGEPVFEKAFNKSYIDEMILLYKSWN